MSNTTALVPWMADASGRALGTALEAVTNIEGWCPREQNGPDFAEVARWVPVAVLATAGWWAARLTLRYMLQPAAADDAAGPARIAARRNAVEGPEDRDQEQMADLDDLVDRGITRGRMMRIMSSTEPLTAEERSRLFTLGSFKGYRDGSGETDSRADALYREGNHEANKLLRQGYDQGFRAARQYAAAELDVMRELGDAR